MSYEQAADMNDIITEKELLQMTGVSKSTLDGLRYSGHLPYTKMSKTSRLYFVADVLDLLKKNRRTIKRSET